MTLWETFEELPDPRTGPAQRHDLRKMIVMALSVVMCGANNWLGARIFIKGAGLGFKRKGQSPWPTR